MKAPYVTTECDYIQPSDWNISAAGRRQIDSASMWQGKMLHVG